MLPHYSKMSTSTMQAIRIESLGEAVLESAPIPQLRDDYILVKTRAVAINPADWKSIDYIATPGETVGCDYSGVVVQVGALLQDQFRPGDRVAGIVHGCEWSSITCVSYFINGLGNASNHADGAFAEFVIAKGDLQMRIPHNMSFETAATLGAGITTVGQSLYQSLALPLPESGASNNYVLIYGGSTATGSLAIQFAKLYVLSTVIQKIGLTILGPAFKSSPRVRLVMENGFGNWALTMFLTTNRPRALQIFADSPATISHTYLILLVPWPQRRSAVMR